MVPQKTAGSTYPRRSWPTAGCTGPGGRRRTGSFRLWGKSVLTQLSHARQAVWFKDSFVVGLGFLR